MQKICFAKTFYGTHRNCLTLESIFWCNEKVSSFVTLDMIKVDLQPDQDQLCLYRNSRYGKCPKISYTKLSDEMAYVNNADPDQTAPEGAV